MKYFVSALLFIVLCFQAIASKPYYDQSHYSKIFGSHKTYRLYLPECYSGSEQKYPVIYFFHGWGGRHFKDPSAKLEYEMIGDLVSKYKVILVMWDGSMDEEEPRPYNVGNHNDVKYRVQMVDYFPELVTHIDSTYRTLTHRNQRGIIGFSMGGFIAGVVAGKYPCWVSAAVSLTGSPEFYIGTPENHTLYPIRYTLDNLRDVAFMLHNREMCPMAGLNDEVGNAALWAGMEDFQYLRLLGAHMVDEPGETKIFESAMKFVVDRFNNPVPPNDSWSHYDLYPSFSLWGYSVESNKNEPGFLYLRNVSPSGFGFYTHQWLPGGAPLKNCKATISTAPIYNPSGHYDIRIFHKSTGETETRKLTADSLGRLHIALPGHGCEVGIVQSSMSGHTVVSGYSINQNKSFVRVNQSNTLAVNLFIRNGKLKSNRKIKVTLSCADSSVSIINPVQTVKLQKNSDQIVVSDIGIECFGKPPTDGTPGWLRMVAKIEPKGFVTTDEFLLPVWYDLEVFPDYKMVRHFTEGQYKSDTVQNGNKVRASDNIEILIGERRLMLYSDDETIVEKMVDYDMVPAHWPDGFTPVSKLKLAENATPGHEVELIGFYETKSLNPIYRKRHWGKIMLQVIE